MYQWLLPPYLVQSGAGHAELQSQAGAIASNASLTSMLPITQPQAQLSGVDRLCGCTVLAASLISSTAMLLQRS